MSGSAGLQLSRCEGCAVAYLPRVGPCPRCGASGARPLEVPSTGVTLAATELTSPAAGWTSPHRLALVEVAESVRLLGVVDADLPSIGDAVEVRFDGTVYHVRRRTA